MTATVRAGEIGFDSSFSHPPVQRTVELHFAFRVGYISTPPSAPGKNITIAECGDTIDAGQRLMLVWEKTADRATLGAMYGTLDGAEAKREADLRGQPHDAPILFADDTSTTVANLPRKMAYMYAAAAACAPYPMGIYGGVKILAPLVGLWVVGWVPITAWSWSVSVTRQVGETTAAYNARGRAACIQAAHDVGAHVLQDKGYYIDNTWAVDPNVAIADFPAWGHPDPTPTPQGDDDMKIAINKEARSMPYGVADPLTAVFVVGEFKRNVGAEELAALYPGVTPAPLSNAALDAIPDYVAAPGGSPAPTHFAITLTGGAVAQ